MTFITARKNEFNFWFKKPRISCNFYNLGQVTLNPDVTHY